MERAQTGKGPDQQLVWLLVDLCDEPPDSQMELGTNLEAAEGLWMARYSYDGRFLNHPQANSKKSSLKFIYIYIYYIKASRKQPLAPWESARSAPLVALAMND